MPEAVFSQLLHRRPNSHKYDFGHVLIIGGSPGMVGAPLLAGRAALRIGAGLVTIASTADVTDKLEKRVEEIMTLAISANSTEALAKLRDSINERKVNAVVVGPGLSPDKSELVRQLVKSIELPMIIDGGGLSALKEVKTLQSKGRTLRDVVLTPHAGEFKRLIGRDLPKDENERSEERRV